MNHEIFQALLDWNPWVNGPFPDALIGYPRDYDLIPYLQVPEIKIIEGVRRSGKSTLLYQVIHHVLKTNQHILYINFEDEVLKKYPLSKIIETYLEHAPIHFLFIDEIQNCNDWVSFARKTYDRREINQLWISGSNSALIKEDYATLLTGRSFPIHVSPLSFYEFLSFKSLAIQSLPGSKKQEIAIRQAFNEYMHFGSFPAVVNRPVLKKELLIAYFDDFIYKDIVGRYQLNGNKIRELAIYLASNTSKIFSYRSIGTSLNTHPNTIMDYFGYLKDIFLFEELYKFDYSLKKQMIHEKKVYCIDTGLASAISFRFSEDRGRLLENIVFCELRRRRQEVYFHKNISECDFVIKAELSIVEAIQVCASLQDPKTKAREIKGLLEAMQTYQLKCGLILTEEEEKQEEILHENITYSIHIKPVWKWLLEASFQSLASLLRHSKG